MLIYRWKPPSVLKNMARTCLHANAAAVEAVVAHRSPPRDTSWKQKRCSWYPEENIPIRSMYGIFTNIYPINFPNVGKYTIHGAFGIQKMWKTDVSPTKMIYISGGFSKSMLVYRCTCWNGGFCVWYEKWKGWGWHLDFLSQRNMRFMLFFLDQMIVFV